MCGGPYLFTPLLPDGTNLSRIMSFQLLPLKALCSLRHSGQLPWLLVGPQLWESHQQRPEGRKLGPDPTPPRCLPASQSDAHAQGTRKSHQVFILVSSEGTESHTSQSGGKGVTNHQKVALHFKTG